MDRVSFKFTLSKRCAFTLVELLMAVAIIAMLVALLAPSLRSARAAAHSAACQGSLRQLGMAHIQLAMNHDGWCVPFIVGNPYQPNVAAGDPVHNPYPGAERWNSTLFGADGIADVRDFAGCPAATSYQYGNPAYAAGFILQMYLMAFDVGISGMGQRAYRGTAFHRMESPAETLFMIDGVAWGGLQAVAYSSRDPALYALYGENASGGIPTRIAYRHGGRANGLFYDGHVQGLTPAELTAHPDTGSFAEGLPPGGASRAAIFQQSATAAPMRWPTGGKGRLESCFLFSRSDPAGGIGPGFFRCGA